nr:hypothetical protein [Tanacetum cinerariifolium]
MGLLQQVFTKAGPRATPLPSGSPCTSYPSRRGRANCGPAPFSWCGAGAASGGGQWGRRGCPGFARGAGAGPGSAGRTARGGAPVVFRGARKSIRLPPQKTRPRWCRRRGRCRGPGRRARRPARGVAPRPRRRAGPGAARPPARRLSARRLRLRGACTGWSESPAPNPVACLAGAWPPGRGGWPAARRRAR